MGRLWSIIGSRETPRNFFLQNCLWENNFVIYTFNFLYVENCVNISKIFYIFSFKTFLVVDLNCCRYFSCLGRNIQTFKIFNNWKLMKYAKIKFLQTPYYVYLLLLYHIKIIHFSVLFRGCIMYSIKCSCQVMKLTLTFNPNLL